MDAAQQAEARIAELEARLAVVESKCESFYVHPGPCVTSISGWGELLARVNRLDGRDPDPTLVKHDGLPDDIADALTRMQRDGRISPTGAEEVARWVEALQMRLMHVEESERDAGIRVEAAERRATIAEEHLAELEDDQRGTIARADAAEQERDRLREALQRAEQECMGCRHRPIDSSIPAPWYCDLCGDPETSRRVLREDFRHADDCPFAVLAAAGPSGEARG